MTERERSRSRPTPRKLRTSSASPGRSLGSRSCTSSANGTDSLAVCPQPILSTSWTTASTTDFERSLNFESLKMILSPYDSSRWSKARSFDMTRKSSEHHLAMVICIHTLRIRLTTPPQVQESLYDETIVSSHGVMPCSYSTQYCRDISRLNAQYITSVLL